MKVRKINCKTITKLKSFTKEIQILFLSVLGIDGFCIPTFMPEPGNGIDLAFRYALEIDNYDMYIGNVSNFVSLDFGSLSQAFFDLITNKKLREDMGLKARKQALEKFDWSNKWSSLDRGGW